jgi:deoxyribose-phosphate aldolase
MRKHAAPHIQVKAAGGVRDLDALLAVRALGVTRCGATRTASMMDDARLRLGLDPIQSTATPASAGY